MKKPPAHKGFTIIETLVAITVLMIAIAGPLSIASKALTAALASRDQMTASYLMQESVEVVKNLRDNNIDAGNPWNTGFSSCTVNAHCDASAIDATPVVDCSIYSGGKCPLKLTTDNFYVHSGSGSASLFTRGFYLTKPGSSAACGGSDPECTLTVAVDWNEGVVPYEVLSSSDIVNTFR